jgi:uncharacterized membrane protein
MLLYSFHTFIAVASCTKDSNTNLNCLIENATIDIKVIKNTPCESIYAANITINTNLQNVQYTINNSGYQNSNQFNNLKAGNYTLQIKDANGCTASKTVSITDSTFEAYGIYFSKVKQIVTNKCVSCHSRTMPYAPGVPYFDTDCDILFYYKKIYNNATVLRNMPLNGSLTAEQINDIKIWYDSGGKVTD